MVNVIKFGTGRPSGIWKFKLKSASIPLGVANKIADLVDLSVPINGLNSLDKVQILPEFTDHTHIVLSEKAADGTVTQHVIDSGDAALAIFPTTETGPIYTGTTTSSQSFGDTKSASVELKFTLDLTTLTFQIDASITASTGFAAGQPTIESVGTDLWYCGLGDSYLKYRT